MKVLVTGGCGFLGMAVARSLRKAGHDVTVFDTARATEPRQFELESLGVGVVKGDISQREAVDACVSQVRPDSIVHGAAIVGGVNSIEAPAATVHVNVEGTVHVLEAMRTYRVPRAFMISSEEVYGSFRYEPADEGHPKVPTTPYGITKVAAEWYGDFYRACYDVDMIHVRTSWVYGAGLPRLRFETKLILDALSNGRASFESGAQHRIDYTHVDDFVAGMKRLVEAPQLEHHAYNISSGRAIQLGELAEVLTHFIPGAQISVGDGLLEFAPGFSAPQKGALSIERARSELGYEPRVAVEAGMESYVDELRRDLANGNLRS